ncbi:MAG TPA: serine/threonine-protein kinase [Polyangiaceae bacterium]|jgi:serine/threonine-protein kinase|nr:serine/threonine-protein kinase [Polyangiaceae bacterium]
MAKDDGALKRLGEVLADRYEITDLLGSGGQGHVYKALDRTAGDYVAIKVLRREFTDDPAWRERAQREARVLALLRNTAAVKVYDQKYAADGALCIVMELLVGASFEDKLLELDKAGIKISPADLVPILDPIVSTLEVAHVNQVLHRDLKPDNIFILNDATVRLIDFGFARFQRLMRLTRVGQVAGSPSYLAPECWTGDPDLVTHKIDVYSLGAVIFRALCGRPPFVGTPAHLIREVPRAPRPSLVALRPDVPAPVDDWVQAALAAKPADRFDSVRALWTAFRLASGVGLG